MILSFLPPIHLQTSATRRISLDGNGSSSSEDKENGNNSRKRSTAESRNARFTNAKALFEKLGSTDELDKDNTTTTTSLPPHAFTPNSRASSAGGRVGQTPPNGTPAPPAAVESRDASQCIFSQAPYHLVSSTL